MLRNDCAWPPRTYSRTNWRPSIAAMTGRARRVGVCRPQAVVDLPDGRGQRKTARSSRRNTSATGASSRRPSRTLATDRALLLLGVPGTAKSWVSEHLAAAGVRFLAAVDTVHVRHG